MLKTFVNAWKLSDLRAKILFTLMIIVIYRIGCALPVPFIDVNLIKEWFGNETDGTMFQYMDILSGEAFSQATLFALSVSPYITSSIVIQLLTIAIPALERLSKEGEEGKKKLTQITRYTTVAIALLTSYGYYVTLNNAGAIKEDGFFVAAVIISCHCAGAALIMWLAEKINENGIGNGISMILFANIIASLPTMAEDFVENITQDGGTIASIALTVLMYALIAVIGILIVAFVVFMTESERKIPVQYAKRVVGRKMYGGQSTHLPIKLNMSGVMPIIFASSILMLPATLGMFFPPKAGSFWEGFVNLFSTQSAFYIIVELILIVAFSYFYLAISFNPVEVANNLKKNGGFIPGLRPGKPTSDFIASSLKKITLIGAFFLAIIAVLPMAVNALTYAISSGAISLGSVAFGGTSMLIVVGVALETVRDLESQITMRHYKGFLG